MSLASNSQQQPFQQWPATPNAVGNGPLVPHIKPCAPHSRLCSMGDDPPSKQIYFLRGWGGVRPSKHSYVTVMHHRQNKGAHWGPYTPSTPPKLYPLARGVVSYLSDPSARGANSHVGCSGAFLPSAAMVVMVWVSPESSCLKQDDSCIVLRWTRRNKGETKRNRKQISGSYVGVLLLI